MLRRAFVALSQYAVALGQNTVAVIKYVVERCHNWLRGLKSNAQSSEGDIESESSTLILPTPALTEASTISSSTLAEDWD